MEADQESKAASANIERLVTQMPASLAEREAKFSSQLIRAKLNPAKKLERLYSFMNELYSHILKYTPCRKGCNACCHYKVSVSDIEIAHIEAHTKKRRNKKFLPKSEFHGTPCPFLHQGSCSIYEARPLVCRRHVTLTSTSYWCDPKVSFDKSFPMIQISSVDEAFEHIRKTSNSVETYDIRQVFGD